jgi:hypothetical protein
MIPKISVIVALLILVATAASTEQSQAAGRKRVAIRSSSHAVCAPAVAVVNKVVANYPVEYRSVAALPLSTGYDFVVDNGAYQWRVNPQYYAYQSYIQSMHSTQAQDSTTSKSDVDDATIDVIADKVAKILAAKGGYVPPGIVGGSDSSTSDAGGASISPEELDKQMSTLMAANCKKCHTEGSNPKGDLSLFDSSGVMKSNLPFEKILKRVTTDDESLRMPPKGPLGEEDMLIVQRWHESFVTGSGEGKEEQNPFNGW